MQTKNMCTILHGIHENHEMLANYGCQYESIHRGDDRATEMWLSQ
jgi:hypothetical protein